MGRESVAGVGEGCGRIETRPGRLLGILSSVLSQMGSRLKDGTPFLSKELLLMCRPSLSADSSCGRARHSC